MKHDPEIHQFLLKHLQSIMENDVEGYHASPHEELTLYEWFVTPHRLDGLPFHDFMMQESARRGAVFSADVVEGHKANTQMDLANLKIQRYGDTAIASYTMLVSSGTPDGVKVTAHNESRVMVKFDDGWQVVHVHKSPAWQAPFTPPGE